MGNLVDYVIFMDGDLLVVRGIVEYVPGVYHVYDSYEDGHQELLTSPDGRHVAMPLTEAVILLADVKEVRK